jgi:hypothetical protein
MSETRARPRAGKEAVPAVDPNADHHATDRSDTPATGGGVLLSPEWTRERGLPAGGPIEIVGLADGSLVLRPAVGSFASASFSVTSSPSVPREHLFRELVAAYLGGATGFSISEPEGLRPATRRVVQEFIERTGTPKVVSDDARGILLRDTSPEDAVPVAELLRRMYQAVRAIQETAGGFLESSPPVDASGLSVRDDDVDRQAWLVERILVLGLARGGTPGRVAPTRTDPISPILLARALERIADHAVVFGEHAARLAECSIPDPIRGSLGAFHRQALEYLDRAFDVAEAPDVRRANDLLDTGAALHAAQRSLSESFLVRGGAAGLSPLASADLAVVLQSLDRTVAYSEDLVEVGLDRAVAGQLSTGASDDARTELATPAR